MERIGYMRGFEHPSNAVIEKKMGEMKRYK